MGIIKVFLKNFIRGISLLFGVSIVTFSLINYSPIDPVSQYLLGKGTVSEAQRIVISEYFGVNQTAIEKYINWLLNILNGNLGTSLLYRQPVIDIIQERFLNTFILMLSSWILSGLIGFTLGCIMGTYNNTTLDKTFKKICLILSSTPTFWLGMIFILVFSVFLGWFPIGFSSPIGVLNENITFSQRIHHLILPAATLALTSFANIALHTREKLIEVLDSEYCLFAKARGENMKTIVLTHGIRNISIPAITLQFASISELFSGSILAETVFSYPGLGSTITKAGIGGDLPLLLGITLFSVLFVFVGNMIANFLYILIDPRIREGNFNE